MNNIYFSAWFIQISIIIIALDLLDRIYPEAFIIGLIQGAGENVHLHIYEQMVVDTNVMSPQNIPITSMRSSPDPFSDTKTSGPIPKSMVWNWTLTGILEEHSLSPQVPNP